MITRLVAFFSLSLAPMTAQATWIVNAGGGPGVDFVDLPSAVASPNVVDGDTILVQTGPFGEGATPFTTGKGLTIVGVGGGVPFFTTASLPVEISGLPAGRAFRMVGFTRPTDGPLHVRVVNCAGTVHLENLHADEPDWVSRPGRPSSSRIRRP